MTSARPVDDMVKALNARQFPTIIMWNRLEGRPRTPGFERALQAEVRDPLWMLCKQWQMGEFRGSDAGSPVFAKLQVDTTRLTKYRPGEGTTQPFEDRVPLEARVEHRPVPFAAGGPLALDLRLAMGRRWLALIADVGSYRQAFVDAYPFPVPDPDDPADARICAHAEAWQLAAALAGRAMDGGALHQHLAIDPGNHAYDGVAGVADADRAALDDRAARFLAWFGRVLLQPAGDDAWAPDRLEYRFAASAPEPGGVEKVYAAGEYGGTSLDWYSMDVDVATPALGPVPGSDVTGLPDAGPRTTIPVPVSFAGMPNTRWWTFEDHRTNFGDIDASTTDLARLLFMEFALVYANDWFVIPHTLPAGAIATVRGLAVTNVFGERLWIEPAGSGADADWQRWSMFVVNVTGKAGAAADTSLLVLPTAARVQESPPTEEVSLVRDEVANMVWGVEQTIPLATGGTRPGREAARELHAFLQSRIHVEPKPAAGPTAPVRYLAMTTVPEHWIPFIPVHVDGDNREIQLRRAAMPRLLEGGPVPPDPVQPRTVLLRPGLDGKAPGQYLVHEEQVPRAGTRLSQAWRRTRWTDGRVHTWLRVRHQTGRGEASSGLAFDQLVNQPPA